MTTAYRGKVREETALDAYVKLNRAVNTVRIGLWARVQLHGLSAGQFGVLEALYYLGPLCQKELTQKHLQSPGNITMVLNNLEKKGFVRRREGSRDRRRNDVHLLKKGEAFIRRAFPAHVAAVVQVFSALSQKEQKTLGGLCKKLGLRGSQVNL